MKIKLVYFNSPLTKGGGGVLWLPTPQEIFLPPPQKKVTKGIKVI